MILSCSNISKAFGTEEILKHVSFHVEDHEKAAIVGINGAGKSTLLKIIVGELAADEGSVTITKGKTLGYLAQHQDLHSQTTIYDSLLEVKRPILEMEQQIRTLELQMKHAEGEKLETMLNTYSRLNHEFELLNGYAWQSEITGVLKGLGFVEEEFSKPVSELSGGQKTRVSLGKLLLSKPDIILLDEPTNHLDMESIAWLETYLMNYAGTVIIVAHDRYFLDRVVTKIVELDGGIATSFQGNYTAYSEKKAIIRAGVLKAYLNQQQEIRHRTRDLRQRQDEFEQITGSMREGLVLLDHSGRILSINPAAQALFHADGTCVGQDFLTVDRHPDLTAAIHDAAETGHSQLRAERRGREYQLDFSRIESNGKVLGTVLLAFDVTEQAEAERMRREFTANVSHELKTPLQSIIGSAELLENGLVKPEDQPRFLNRIHQEADRLVALINDILRLSQLDEGGALPHEQVSVLELAQEAARSLTEQEAAQAVHISVTGTAGTVFGVRRLLYEIARNLCENAVKYNVPGGSVTVEVAETDRDVTLLVRDTGIGIPEGDQSRVFERFYRVDKSHSRAIGGTGLGLSIVKHAVAYHHGTLRLESQPGKGTVITVTLPKEPTE